MSATSRGRGRGRGRGMRGMMMGFNPYMGGYVAMMPIRGRGRGFRYDSKFDLQYFIFFLISVDELKQTGMHLIKDYSCYGISSG